MLYYGVWGGIRGYNVDIRVGHVVCRQLGYSRAERIFSYASFGGVIGPLWIWRIQCNGNETEISQCKVETWDKIWKTSSDRLYRRFRQHPRNAASLLCSKAKSSFSKGRYNLQRSLPSEYIRHKVHSEIIGHFFSSFFVVVSDYCFRPTDVFVFSCWPCTCVFVNYILINPWVYFFHLAEMFMLLPFHRCVFNFVFIASPMCFTCLRSGLSSFASIKICFFLSNPFFLLLFGGGTLFYFIHLLYFSSFSPSCFTVPFTWFCDFQS